MDIMHFTGDDYESRTITLTIPKFISVSKSSMVTAVYLNNDPLGVWYHDQLHGSNWIWNIGAAYIEYTKCEFDNSPKPDYLKAYIYNNFEEKTKFHFKETCNIVCMISTTKDRMGLPYRESEIRMGCILSKIHDVHHCQYFENY